MIIHYKKSIGFGFILIGVIFAILLLLSGDFSRNFGRLVLASFLVFYGTLMVSKPYFILNDTSLEISAILGSAKKTYNFTSFSELQIENNKIYLVQSGKKEKILVNKWMVDNYDWQSIVEKINS